MRCGEAWIVNLTEVIYDFSFPLNKSIKKKKKDNFSTKIFKEKFLLVSFFINQNNK